MKKLNEKSTNQRLVTYLREVKGERVTTERAAETDSSMRFEPTIN